MIDRAEPNSKLSCFEGVINLVTELQALNPLPVLVREGCIIHRQQSWPLTCTQVRMHKGLGTMSARINIELDRLCASIISILNQFLNIWKVKVNNNTIFLSVQ